MTDQEPGRIEPLRPYQLGLGRAFELLQDAVVVAEAGNGRVVFWNPAAEQMFGHTPREAIGLLIEELMPQRMRELHRHGLARFNRTGHGGYIDSHSPIQLPALHKGGEEFSIELTLTALEDMPVPGRFVMAIIRDITERTRSDEELRQSHTRLQAELLEREPSSE